MHTQGQKHVPTACPLKSQNTLRRSRQNHLTQETTLVIGKFQSSADIRSDTVQERVRDKCRVSRITLESITGPSGQRLCVENQVAAVRLLRLFRCTFHTSVTNYFRHFKTPPNSYLVPISTRHSPRIAHTSSKINSTRQYYAIISNMHKNKEGILWKFTCQKLEV